MDQSILHVLNYFEFFFYPPSLNELKLFLDKKISSQKLESVLHTMEKKGLLYRKDDRIALKNNLFSLFENQKRRSIYYFNEAKKTLLLCPFLSLVCYIGISGSLSMMNMTEEGDIDIFIITKEKTLWITRFFFLLYKYYLKVSKPNIGNKLCFNLIFAENGLKIEKSKQNEYIGHEILQLKSILNRDNTFELFVSKNKWILQIFPNAQIYNKVINVSKKTTESMRLHLLEFMLKKIQVWWLHRKRYQYVEQNGQLWLIQNDFERKILSGGYRI